MERETRQSLRLGQAADDGAGDAQPAHAGRELIHKPPHMFTCMCRPHPLRMTPTGRLLLPRLMLLNQPGLWFVLPLHRFLTLRLHLQRLWVVTRVVLQVTVNLGTHGK